MIDKEFQIHDSWYKHIADEFSKQYFLDLQKFLAIEKSNYTIFPKSTETFSAFNYTHFEDVKVVIIGQDPYHGPGQAHGLCFSVPQGVKIPPSLRNIYKELRSDVGMNIPSHGNLESWAKQGVLLINATLSVRAHAAGSHQKKGWEIFTDNIISTISEKREHVVFLLWGNYAQAKSTLIDESKHYILKSVHPSPLSAFNGFFGCKHFSKTNELLSKHKIESVNWNIEDKWVMFNE